MIQVEIACTNQISCIHAVQGGADRIELFENIHEGGCTPSYGLIRWALDYISTPIYVMIRPRGGDFVYSSDEIEAMLYDIDMCREMGVAGIVTGVLHADNSINTPICEKLLHRWGNSSATFHRAVDRTSDYMNSVGLIYQMGYERMLTSGGHPDIMIGLDNIKKAALRYQSNMIIMPGGGVNPQNVADILRHTQTREIHSTCRIQSSPTPSPWLDSFSLSSLEVIEAFVSNAKNAFLQ